MPQPGNPGVSGPDSDRIRDDGDRLLDMLDVYDRIVEEELYQEDEIPSEIRLYIEEIVDDNILEIYELDSGFSWGRLLAMEIKDFYGKLSGSLQRYYDDTSDADRDSYTEREMTRVRRATSRAHRSGSETVLFHDGVDEQAAKKHADAPDEMSVHYLIKRDMDLSEVLGMSFRS